MAKTPNQLKAEIVRLADAYGCELYEHAGSHFVIYSRTFHDPRTWITNNHYLTSYFLDDLRGALEDLLDYLQQGFVDNGDACDDQDLCETCEALGRLV